MDPAGGLVPVGAPAAVEATSSETTREDGIKGFATAARRGAWRVLVPLGKVALKVLWVLTVLLWKVSLMASDVVIALALMWEGGRPKPGRHMSWDRKLRPFLLQRQGGLCIYCRASLRHKPSDIDHIMPWFAGEVTTLKTSNSSAPGATGERLTVLTRSSGGDTRRCCHRVWAPCRQGRCARLISKP